VSVFYRDDGDGSAFREGWQTTAAFKTWRVGRAFVTATADPARLFFDTFLNRDVEASFARFLAEARPELVHFQHLMLLSVRLPMLVRQAGIPMLLTLHDYWFKCANSQLVWPDERICRGKLAGINCARCATARVDSPLLKLFRPAFAPLFWWRDWLVRRAALCIGRFISPSQFLADQYRAVGFPGDKLTVLENGIDLDRIRSFPRQSVADQILRVTYLGSLAWQKGVHILAAALRGLPPARIRLRIFGNPNVFPDYAARLKDLCDPHNTVLEGPIPNSRVGQVLAETDILAVPSLWYENSPVVIQEAHAAGTPVLASRLGALSEKVRDGVDGLLVSPGDVAAWRAALQYLLDTPTELERLRANVLLPLPLAEHVKFIEALYTLAVEERKNTKPTRR